MYTERTYRYDLNKSSGTEVLSKRPELQEFIDDLRMEIDSLSKLSDQLFHYANKFMALNREEKLQSEPPVKPDGIMEMLKHELNRIKKYNNILSQTCNCFQNIVGD